jgi:hypothetical protein
LNLFLTILKQANKKEEFSEIPVFLFIFFLTAEDAENTEGNYALVNFFHHEFVTLDEGGRPFYRVFKTRKPKSKTRWSGAAPVAEVQYLAEQYQAPLRKTLKELLPLSQALPSVGAPS